MPGFQSWGAWRADLSKCPPGSIVLLKNPLDSSGKKATNSHWFVILGPASEYRLGGKLEAIAVSSSIPRDRIDPRIHFQMPFRENSGHPDTGFSKPCYACVNWVIEIPVIESDEINIDFEIKAQDEGYFLPTAYFAELIARRDSFKASQMNPRLRGK